MSPSDPAEPSFLGPLRTALAERYRIEGELGRGGMAIVYSAQDLKHQRRVAIKLLRPEIAVALGAERFLREIRIAAGLQHPNILPLYDSGEAAGALYYVMPYVEGESLRDRLTREGQLPVAEALAIAAETGDALGYAHSHDVVHRDIKPENILLSGGHALVADFGIARAISAAGGDRVTETGIAVGTPAYMSPEQATGAAHLDGRADIYALGCVVYEMLAGTPPFTGPSAQAILARHTVDPVPPLRTLRPGVPSGVEGAVTRALAKIPADRFPTAAAFNEGLQGGGGSAPPKRSMWRWGAVAAAVVIAAGGIGYGLLHRSAPPPSIGVLPFRNLSPDPNDQAFSDGMAEELTAAFGKVEGMRVAAPTSAGTFRNSTANPQEIGRALGVGTLVEGSVLRAGGRWRVVAHLINARTGYDLWSDVYERDARDVFAVQDEIVRAIVGALRVRLAGPVGTPLVRRATASPEAHELYLQGRYFYEQRSRAGLEKGMAFFQQAIAKDSGYALAYAGLADSYDFLTTFGYATPREMFPLAKAAAARAIQLDSTLPEAHTTLGFIALFYDWDWGTADREFRRALALDSTFTPALLYHAWYDVAVGKPEDGIRDMEQARAMDPLSLVLNTRLGTMYYWARHYDLAVAQVQRVLVLDSTYYLASSDLGRAELALGHCAEALRAVARRQEFFNYEAYIAGGAYAHCGRRADAQATIATLEERRRQGLYASPEAIALVFAALGERDSMFAWLERAYEERTWSLYLLKVEPQFDGVRGDPRFVDLVRRVGLP